VGFRRCHSLAVSELKYYWLNLCAYYEAIEYFCFLCGPTLISHTIFVLPFSILLLRLLLRNFFSLPFYVFFLCFYSSVWSGFTYFACDSDFVSYFHTFRPFVYLLMDCNQCSCCPLYLCDACGLPFCHHRPCWMPMPRMAD